MLAHTGSNGPANETGLIIMATAQLDLQPKYGIGGIVFIGESVVQWLRDSLRTIKSSGDLEGLTTQAHDT
jgi:glycerol kinase|tara:strand:+ start:332 stop:541 length:210 start_codon:yes stop_codon:yes gene_type:complete